MAKAKNWDGTQLCSLARTLEAVGERWTFLILREATAGTTRFSGFRDALGISSDILAARLATLVDGGIMRRESYKEPGRRPRDEYVLTESGRGLDLVLAALQQWGDKHVPSPVPTITYRDRRGLPLRVTFVDQDGHLVDSPDVQAQRPAPGEDAGQVEPGTAAQALPVAMSRRVAGGTSSRSPLQVTCASEGPSDLGPCLISG